MSLRERSRHAIADEHLHATLAKATNLFQMGRGLGASTVANWEELREAGRSIRASVLSRLPDVLERLAANVEARGGHVCWASDAGEANDYVAGIVRRTNAKLAVKSKSMASEEIHLNRTLASLGCEPVETDLGEWIIQLAGETPSHIIAPAIHKTRGDVQKLFNRIAGGNLSDVPEELCAFARAQLRQKFLSADLGITGVNFGIAETGSILIVTNEGNGRMCTSLPKVHIAIMGMERVVETWDELDVMLALLPRAATGQQISVYTTIVTGPRRPDEVDGPDEFHLVILDNGRSEALGTEFQEILHCIRCGACLNVCPVYRQIGGHAYGSVYSGPIGAVLTPVLTHDEELSGASSLCSACWQACPVKIPLQDLLLGLRRRKAPDASLAERAMWRAWAAAWSRPAAYRASARAAALGVRALPWAPRWSAGRELPRPHGKSFRARFEAGEI
jgi:L-lactate dehydrogenase complex protein LldF